MGFDTFSKLFETGVLPILEYGSEIWGFKFYKCTDGIQERAIRFFLGLHKFTPIPALRGEIGWVSTQHRRWACMIHFWNRLLKKHIHSLAYKIFQLDLAQANDSSNWSSELKAVLSNVQMEYLFDSRSVWDLEMFKQRCNGCYQQEY